MTVQDLIDTGRFACVNRGNDTEREVTCVFCCDLLSVAMGRGKEDAAWVTVMGNINTLAVASLTDMSCIILAEGAEMDAVARDKAEKEGITVLRTPEPIFETALAVHRMIAGS